MKRTLAKQINYLIGDPYEGPYEGDDYWVEGDEINVTSLAVAAKILREINQSDYDERRLVKFRQAGDITVLGFDTTQDASPVFSRKIGIDKKTFAEVKISETGRFCIFINSKRESATHRTISAAKKYLVGLNKSLLGQQQ